MTKQWGSKISKPTKAPSLAFAVRWIAENDEPESRSLDEMRSLISVVLIADLFGLDEVEVARHVIREREISDAYRKGSAV